MTTTRKQDRNLEIVRRRRNGEKFTTIAADFGITADRANAIYIAEMQRIDGDETPPEPVKAPYLGIVAPPREHRQDPPALRLSPAMAAARARAAAAQPRLVPCSSRIIEGGVS